MCIAVGAGRSYLRSPASRRRAGPYVELREALTVTKISKRPPVVRPSKHSPNRHRLIARLAVWSVAASGVAIWLPHVFA